MWKLLATSWQSDLDVETEESRTPISTAVSDALRNLSQALAQLATALDNDTRADRPF